MADAEEGGGGGGERLDPRLEALCQYCLRTLKARQLFVGLIFLMFPGLAGTHFYKSFFTRGRPGKDGLICKVVNAPLIVYRCVSFLYYYTGKTRQMVQNDQSGGKHVTNSELFGEGRLSCPVGRPYASWAAATTHPVPPLSQE